ncbi:MAG: class I SAM-dependent methyltransferase [Gemmatimonadaceae bacterium]
MSVMKSMSGVMENTLAYRLWQAPFAEKKLAPLFAHTDVASVRRVLDVGCGPGTNASHFAHADYLGIDFNPAYIESARRRYGREFIVADVTKYEVPPDRRFDLILANSLFHHIDDAGTRRILAQLPTLLAPDGFVHIFDLVLPERPSVSRMLARADRGDYPRPVEAWRSLFSESLEPVVFEEYPLGAAGVTLWNMIYFKGRARR